MADAIDIIAHMRSHQKTMRFLHGDTYAARSAETQSAIRKVMDRKKTSILNAAIDLAKACEAHPHTVMLIMASALDMLMLDTASRLKAETATPKPEPKPDP